MSHRYTQIVHIDPQQPDPELLAQAATLLQAGKLVAFPTETVYGLGANALDTQAVAGIFEAKGRPTTDPLIVHLAELTQLERVACELPALAFTLAEQFWPGPLTLVVRRKPGVPALVSAGLDTIAVRIPAHRVARGLLIASDLPVAAPSANRFARPSPTSAAHVLADLDGRVDLIIDAGSSRIGLESTVLDLTRDEPVVLRPGGVSLEDLRTFIPELRFIPRYLDPSTASAAPGGMLRHYAPDTPLTLFTGERDAVLACMRAELESMQRLGQRAGLLLSEEDLTAFYDLSAITHSLGSEADQSSMATRLFAGLRELDQAGIDRILTRAVQQSGLGLAIWDRLLRAADGRVIQC